jgi:hypothetical protein
MVMFCVGYGVDFTGEYVELYDHYYVIYPGLLNVIFSGVAAKDIPTSL